MVSLVECFSPYKDGHKYSNYPRSSFSQWEFFWGLMNEDTCKKEANPATEANQDGHLSDFVTKWQLFF